MALKHVCTASTILWKGTEHLIPQNIYFAEGIEMGPKTASQLSGYYIEMYPKQVALIS